jgi:hypothetical protein
MRPGVSAEVDRDQAIKAPVADAPDRRAFNRGTLIIAIWGFHLPTLRWQFRP